MNKFKLEQSIDLEVITAELLELWHMYAIGEWLTFDTSEHWYRVVQSVDKKHIQHNEDPHQTVSCGLNIRIHRALFEVNGLEINCWDVKREHRLGVFSLQSIIAGCLLMQKEYPQIWTDICDGEAMYNDYDKLLKLIVYGETSNIQFQLLIIQILISTLTFLKLKLFLFKKNTKYLHKE